MMFGITAPIAMGDGDTDSDDLQDWREDFVKDDGTESGFGLIDIQRNFSTDIKFTITVPVEAVPEPTTLSLCLVCLVAGHLISARSS